MSEQLQAKLNNKYDNSDQLTVNEKQDKFLGASTGGYDEIIETTKYIQYLKSLSEIEKDGGSKIKVGGREIEIKSLLPARSQFEEQRLQIIALVNSLGVDDPLVKGMMRDFGTESVFELSSAYANYALGRDRADKIYQVLNATYDDGGQKPVFDALLGGDKDKRANAKEALSKGKVVIGFGASTRPK